MLLSQVLGHQVPEHLLPDVALVAELSDTAELGKLLQLVLGCAISCERKQGMYAQTSVDASTWWIQLYSA